MHAENLLSQTREQSSIAFLVTKAADTVTTGSLAIQGVPIRTLGSSFACEQPYVITEDQVKLTADRVTYDRGTGELSAKGTVEIAFVGFVGLDR